MFEALKKLLPDPEIKEEDLERYKRARGLYITDPWERVKTIFSLDEYKNLHPELLRAIQAAQFGLIFGAGYGGVKESVRRQREFIRTNDTNVYLSKNEMYRVMTNKAILGFGRGGLKWAPKIALFSGGFSLFASCCEAYRNKSGILEYVVGGYFAGGISRSILGIKGFIAGGIIGAFLGLVYGVIHVGIEKISRTDALILKYSQYAYLQHRNQLYANFHSTAPPSLDDKLIESVYGERQENPLNALDSEQKKETIEKK